MKIVYWSGTGNTEKMANLIAEGIVEKGKQAEVEMRVKHMRYGKWQDTQE